MLTNQDVYDTVRDHLLRQNRKSFMGPNGLIRTCAYRSLDGAKCAVGCLIPDIQYRRGMEFKDVSDLFMSYPLEMEASGLDHDTHISLLTQLQIVHDRCPLSDWRSQLEFVAHRFELQP